MSPKTNSGVTPVSLTRAGSMPSVHSDVLTEHVDVVSLVLM